jgi:hypothetical protein
MTVQEIDHLTEKFYQYISFNKEHYPRFDVLPELFYGDGKLINNNFDQPVEFTVLSFAQAVAHQIEEGNTDFHSQQEVSDITEVFGKVAHRISVYEYSTKAESAQPWKRGVNYIHFIFSGGEWKIVSMIWNDEKDDVKIPAEYLL